MHAATAEAGKGLIAFGGTMPNATAHHAAGARGRVFFADTLTGRFIACFGKRAISDTSPRDCP